jgi:hypothetical protein
MGRLSDPSGRGREGLPLKRGFRAAATRTVAWLCSGSQGTDEGVWKHLKCVELKNLCCESLKELKVELGKAKERLRHKRDVILGCIRQPEFEV